MILKYSRADLPALKAMDRAAVYAALGSFDAQGLADDAFIAHSLTLLEPARVPGLGGPQPLEAVLKACGRPFTEKGEVEASVLRAADEALQNRFTFYGEPHTLPESIDWDFNPGTAHWGHDLNRFSYLDPLVRAFFKTGDDRYSRKAVGLILDWIAKCDFARAFAGGGYAFGSYLNNAIHAQAWSRVVAQLAAAGQVRPIELLRILKSLQEHLAYLEIVTNGHHGNWPTIGCMGMLATLEALPVLKDTDRFADYCRTSLAAQVAEQVLPDGVQDELTPHYHQVVINNLCTSLRSLRALGRELDLRTLETLRAMVRYSQQTTVPDGSKQVAFNDSDPSAAPRLKEQLGPLGLSGFLRPASELGPEVYPYAGVAFLRQRADEGDLYMAFDAGPFGRAHQHEDKLGFWLFAYGRNFLVDPGRHLYDNSPASFREHMKSTRAHSTILVDGLGQNSVGCRDTWIAQAPLDLGWRVGPEEIRARGQYELGYGPDNAVKVVHTREMVFVRNSFWVMFDELTGDGLHEIESRFQFAPGPVGLEGMKARTLFPDANLLVWPAGMPATAKARIEEGAQNPRGGWYSDGYNKIEPAPALALTVTARLPVRIATLLLPYRGSVPPAVTFDFNGDAAKIVMKDSTFTCTFCKFM
jgi:hypothetical protein